MPFPLPLNLTLAFFAATSFASNILSSDAVHLRADDVLSRPYASLVSDAVGLTRRQDASNQQGGQVNADGSLNMTAWNDATNAACVAALRGLTQSSNPSGNCVCYNLPSLDADTGVFEADLRLFKVSSPRGAFAGIAPEHVKVGLSYSGASVSPVKADSVTGAGMTGSVAGLTRRAAGDPELLQTYMFVGQIDKHRMSGNMSMSIIEALVMPILTLRATNPTGDAVSTNVSSNEAAFLTGVFSAQVVMSDFSAAQAAVDKQTAGLQNGTVAFVMPGTQILILPIGGIITSVWALVGIAAYGFGTFQRMQYAEMYRRRQATMASRAKTF